MNAYIGEAGPVPGGPVLGGLGAAFALPAALLGTFADAEAEAAATCALNAALAAIAAAVLTSILSLLMAAARRVAVFLLASREMAVEEARASRGEKSRLKDAAVGNTSD